MNRGTEGRTEEGGREVGCTDGWTRTVWHLNRLRQKPDELKKD